jgi:hypothetical protein
MGIRLLTIAALLTALLAGTQPVWAQLTRSKIWRLDTTASLNGSETS